MKNCGMHDVNAVRTGAKFSRLLFGLRVACTGVIVASWLLLLSTTQHNRGVHAFSSSSFLLSSSSSIARRHLNNNLGNRPSSQSAGDGARTTRLFVSFSSNDEGVEGSSETSVGTSRNSASNSSSKVESISTARSTDTKDGDNDGFLSTIDGSLISNVGAIVIFLVIGSTGLQFLGSMGGALLTQLSQDVTTVFGNLASIAVAIVTAIFGMLKFLLPVVGRGIADGATAAADSQIVRDAADAVVTTATPVLQGAAATVGRAVDDSIVNPLQQAVDAGIMDPLQSAADTVGRAVDDSIVNPFQQAVDAGIVDPIQDAADTVGRAIPDVQPPELPTLPNLPQMPDAPSVRIGNVRIF